MCFCVIRFIFLAICHISYSCLYRILVKLKFEYRNIYIITYKINFNINKILGFLINLDYKDIHQTIYFY